jgi:alkylation response protein AidB-like acyl-CoA dehydrogenase
VLVAAEAVGAAAATVQAARDYVAVREQFDRPVGSFQAVQSELADLYGEVASAGAAIRRAVRAVEAGTSADVVTEAAVARLRSGAALRRAARQSLHLHGGVGFTWEHPAHLFLKRSLSDRDHLSDSRSQRDLVAAALLAGLP